MRILVAGSKDWSNYGDVMRNMTILLEDLKYAELENKTITIVHSGGRGLEDMITEYIGKVEKFLRQKGYYVREEICKPSDPFNKSINDYNMIEKGADYAMIFSTQGDKRSYYCIKLLEEFGIPTKIINE
jgi:hypothetical protein